MPRTPPRTFSPMRRRALLGGLSLAMGATASTTALAQFRPRGRSTPIDYVLGQIGPARALTLSPTPACDDGAAGATAQEIEGPFYTPDTPRRDDLRDGAAGSVIELVGRVLGTDCEPIAGAVLDFWHADPAGDYDNDGFRFRGHQFTDRDGLFRLLTYRPRWYGEGRVVRTPHFHVKVQGKDTPLLTTQLYFPDEADRNAADRLYRDDLLLSLAGQTARFDFVLAHP